jgi:hypothetical protein
VPLEELARLGVVGLAGHDVPGDGLAGVARMCQKLLREDLEQRLVLDRRDGEFALGPFVAKPRALATGDEEGAGLTLLEKLVAARFGPFVEVLQVLGRPIRIRLDRPDLLGQRELRLVLDVVVHPAGDGLDVERLELRGELLLAGRVKAVQGLRDF